jgi:hypothetical protein
MVITPFLSETKTTSNEKVTPDISTRDKYNIDIPLRSFEYVYNRTRRGVEGFVFIGCVEDLRELHKKVIQDMLEKKGLATYEDFFMPYQLQTSGGRTDLVLEFENRTLVTKLSSWRLRFNGCSWMSDYVVNNSARFHVE